MYVLVHPCIMMERVLLRNTEKLRASTKPSFIIPAASKVQITSVMATCTRVGPARREIANLQGRNIFKRVRC